MNMNKLSVAHELEDKIMDCWSVTSDIKIVYEEYLDSPEPMSEDELSNVLIGIESLYNLKFHRLWQAFEKVCDHGGVWFDKEVLDMLIKDRLTKGISDDE